MTVVRTMFTYDAHTRVLKLQSHRPFLAPPTHTHILPDATQFLSLSNTRKT